MGILDRLAQFLGLKKKEANIIVVGLDNSGKSSYYIHQGDYILTFLHEILYHQVALGVIIL